MMIKYLKYSLTALFFLFITSFHSKTLISEHVIIKLCFVNMVKDKMLRLNDSVYINPFNENYTISKFKYYVSNITFQNNSTGFKEENSYHLIDEADSFSKIIEIKVPADNYKNLQFLLGVDSLHNVSGAQSGDLDPAKDMFWTWNSGYVMAKLEGYSPASAIIDHRFEYHIGGYSGTNKVLKEIRLSLPVSNYKFDAGKSYLIFINADINAWWQSMHDIKIAEHPAVTTPGILAKNISDNYANMFHIEKIIAQ